MDKVIKNLESVQREFNKILLRLSREPDLLVTVSVVDYLVKDMDGNKKKQHIEVETEVARRLL